METKWTKGPWQVYEGGNFVRIGAPGYVEYVKKHSYLGGPFCVAEAEYKATENYSSDHALAMANAHLIAAAPELYEALEFVEDWIHTFLPHQGPAEDNLLTRVQLALAKARGE